MEPIKEIFVKHDMVKMDRQSPLFRLVTLLTFAFLFGVILFPGAGTTQIADCDEKCGENCDDHGESVCNCIDCPLITIVFEIPCSGREPLQTIQFYSIINRSIDVECEFFDRLDRPPRPLLS